MVSPNRVVKYPRDSLAPPTKHFPRFMSGGFFSFVILLERCPASAGIHTTSATANRRRACKPGSGMRVRQAVTDQVFCAPKSQSHRNDTCYAAKNAACGEILIYPAGQSRSSDKVMIGLKQPGGSIRHCTKVKSAAHWPATQT